MSETCMLSSVANRYLDVNSETLVFRFDAARYLPGMDVRIVRKANLALLASEAGSVAALAEKVDSSEKTLKQILAGTPLPSGTPRSVGHGLARRLEIACKKPLGWMDEAHEESVSEIARSIIRRVQNLTDDQLEALDAFLAAISRGR